MATEFSSHIFLYQQKKNHQMIEHIVLGGHNDVGMNMHAIKVGNEVILLDMGLNVDKFVQYTEDREDPNLDPKILTRIGAIPNLTPIKSWMGDIKVIIPSHGHLDHIGAVPYLGKKIPQDIVATPYTIAVIKKILQDNNYSIPNKLKEVPVNGSYKVSPTITAEFINMTHSIPHTAMVCLHTPEGNIVYANDFKLDNTPVLGKKPNLERIEQIGKEGVKLLIIESLNAGEERKTPSEAVAKEMLRDVMLGVRSKGKAIIVTTFSSHISRLKTILDFSKELDREVIFMGRSLHKYVSAAESINLVKFSDRAKVIGFKDKIATKLRQVQKNKGKYLIVMTGHQGEPQSVLSRLISNQFDFILEPDDHVIFSCSVIPNQVNIDNRDRMERELRARKVRIFKDVHVSGHASREDLKDLITILNPKTIVPSHGPEKKRIVLHDLAREMGYKSVLLDDGRTLPLP